MNTYIALLRGINVGGRNSLPMAQLCALAGSLGAQEVRSYIQSGNLVFKAPAKTASGFGAALRQAIETGHGFRPEVLLLGAEALARAAAANPFPAGEAVPTSLHLFFLDSTPPAPQLERIEQLCAPSERYRLDGQVFYLHAPEGVGRSKLAAGSEKLLGVPATARNWRTVATLLEMAQG